MKAYKLEILEDTVKYYSEDVNRLSITYNGGSGDVTSCNYDSDNSDGCAVGRLIPKEERVLLDSLQPSTPVSELKTNQTPCLKKLISDVGLLFLQELQCLHDAQRFWNSEGLSEAGVKYVECIKIKIEDGTI